VQAVAGQFAGLGIVAQLGRPRALGDEADDEAEQLLPACPTTEIRSLALTAGAKLTCAVSVAKLTVAATPSSLFSFFSIRTAHDAHVIPLIARSTCPAGAPAGLTPVPVLTRITLSVADACTTVRSEEKIIEPNEPRCTRYLSLTGGRDCPSAAASW
jgi:hypothetical protein